MTILVVSFWPNDNWEFTPDHNGCGGFFWWNYNTADEIEIAKTAAAKETKMQIDFGCAVSCRTLLVPEDCKDINIWLDDTSWQSPKLDLRELPSQDYWAEVNSPQKIEA
jgi:hypothetical protein